MHLAACALQSCATRFANREDCGVVYLIDLIACLSKVNAGYLSYVAAKPALGAPVALQADWQNSSQVKVTVGLGGTAWRMADNIVALAITAIFVCQQSTLATPPGSYN